MTSTVVRQGPEHDTPGMLREIRISCDHLGCDTIVTNKVIEASGGLKEMGWTMIPQDGEVRHYCPEHGRDVSIRE